MAAAAAVRLDKPGGNPPGGHGSDDDGSFQLLLVEDNPADVDLVRERHRALEQHRQVERLVSAMADAVIVTDTSSIIRFADEAAVRLFGQRQVRLPGRPFEYSVTDESASDITITRGAETRSGELRAMSCEWERKPTFLVTIRDTTEQRMKSPSRSLGGRAGAFTPRRRRDE
jgi:PAS domain-containing protein